MGPRTNKNKYKYEEVSMDNKAIEDQDTEICNSGFGVRHGQAFILFICVSIGYIVKTHLAVTIVAMTSGAGYRNESHPSKPEFNFMNTTKTKEEQGQLLLSDTFNKTNRTWTPDVAHTTGAQQTDSASGSHVTYVWSKWQQEVILMAFFVGTGLMSVPAGVLCQRWGGKRTLLAALTVAGVVSVLTPSLCLWGGWYAIAVCRLMQGSALSAVLPATHTILANWLPISERGRLNSCVYTGTTVGTLAGFQLSGLLVETDWSWPSVFYSIGLLCFLASIVLAVFGSATPADHVTISEKERRLICDQLLDKTGKQNTLTPWREILSSRHAWATFIAQTGSGVSYVFCIVHVPTYVHHVLGFNIKRSAFLSSLPFVAKFVAGIAFGYLSDFCINRQLLSTANVRKIMNSVGEMSIVLSLAAVTFTTNDVLTISCFMVSMVGCSITYSGWLINYIDLAPNYSGALVAFGKILSDIFLMAVPVIVSYAISDMKDRYQWRLVFLPVVALAVVCNMIFILFMSADTQPWNNTEKDNYSKKTQTTRDSNYEGLDQKGEQKRQERINIG